MAARKALQSKTSKEFGKEVRIMNNSTNGVDFTEGLMARLMKNNKDKKIRHFKLTF